VISLDVGSNYLGAIAVDFDSSSNVLLANAFGVYRYTPQGILDTTFGDHGFASLSPGDYSFGSTIVRSTPDGILVVASGGRVARVTHAGRLDASFGVGGFAHLPAVAPNVTDYPLDLAVQPDGRIAIAGYHAANDYSQPLVVRLNRNGSIDRSFATDGRVILHRAARDTADRVAVDAAGRILVAGRADYLPLGDRSYAALTRLNADGSVDTAFGQAGTATAGRISRVERVGAILPTSDGGVVLVGDAIDGLFLSRFTGGAPGPDSRGVTARFDLGTLIITGTSGHDLIRITRAAADGRVEINHGGVPLPPGAAFSRIQILGLGGDDTLDASELALVTSSYKPLALPVTLDGGTGDDDLVGGPASDSIAGGDGRDQIFGNAGNDTLFGGAGDDFLAAGAGNDYLVGGLGHDQLYGDVGNDQLRADDHAEDTLDGGAGFDRYKSDDSDDHLTDVEALLA
jgi:uncharacterized delta-60 repeat protein